MQLRNFYSAGHDVNLKLKIRLIVLGIFVNLLNLSTIRILAQKRLVCSLGYLLDDSCNQFGKCNKD